MIRVCIRAHTESSGDRPDLILSINPDETILAIKNRLNSAKRYKVERQRFYFNGQELRNDLTARHYLIGDHSVVCVSVGRPIMAYITVVVERETQLKFLIDTFKTTVAGLKDMIIDAMDYDDDENIHLDMMSLSYTNEDDKECILSSNHRYLVEYNVREDMKLQAQLR